MEENNIMSGDITALKEVKEAVVNYNTLKENNKKAAEEEARLEKELASARKHLQDEKDSTVKKRRQEVSASYDSELDKIGDKKKKIQGKRDKAKDKGVKERIAEETHELVMQNKDLRKKTKVEIKENKLPKFCGSSAYFTLFMTKGVGEAFIFSLVLILICLILPGGVWKLCRFDRLSNKYQLLTLAACYAVIIVLFAVIYIIIGNKTKHAHSDKLKELRSIRNQIKGNNRQIKKIAKSIKKDKNEEMYGLGDFDSKLTEVNDEYARIEGEKNAALAKFDEGTSHEICAEIDGREMPAINDLEAKLQTVSAEHAQLDTEVSNEKLRISQNYAAYMGKEFTDHAKLDALINIMETGNAETIGDAIKVYKNK